MDVTVGREQVSQIWEQLNAPYQAGRNDFVRTAQKGILKLGWGIFADIEDVLWETDTRADALMRRHNTFKFLEEHCDLRFVSIFRGPLATAKQICGFNAMRAADVAMYVMEVERLGFTVDAEPFVDAIRPTLLRQKHLTNSEVSIIWYKRQRHCSNGIFLRTEGMRPTESLTIITQSGYRATALLEAGKPVMLRVDAPRGKDRGGLGRWIKAELYCGQALAKL